VEADYVRQLLAGPEDARLEAAKCVAQRLNLLRTSGRSQPLLSPQYFSIRWQRDPAATPTVLALRTSKPTQSRQHHARKGPGSEESSLGKK